MSEQYCDNASQLFFRLLDTIGDGTGTTDAIGNYSGAVQEFFVTPQTGTILSIDRLIISISDDSSLTGDGWAGGPQLTNGVEIQVLNGANEVRLDITDGIPLKSNNDLHRIGEVKLLQWGSGGEGVQCIVEFEAPIEIRDTERFSVLLNDDFTGLIHHYFTVQGTLTDD